MRLPFPSRQPARVSMRSTPGSAPSFVPRRQNPAVEARPSFGVGLVRQNGLGPLRERLIDIGGRLRARRRTVVAVSGRGVDPTALGILIEDIIRVRLHQLHAGPIGALHQVIGVLADAYHAFVIALFRHAHQYARGREARPPAGARA